MHLTMRGWLDPCFLLSYSIPEKAADGLLPQGLRPITYQGFAFLNIVISRILRMRPTGIPPSLGLTYWHIAYRLHASSNLASNRTVTGLYFLRSDIDRSLPVLPGNAWTDFRLHKASIHTSAEDSLLRVEITGTLDEIADATVVSETAPTGDDEISPPFRTVEDRERILKYAPFGLSVDRRGQRLKIAEVQRDEDQWEERPVQVQTAEWEYLKRTIPGEARLVRATQVAPIDYRWRIGRIEQL